MDDMYKLADKLVAEVARISASGTDERRLAQYKNRILDYLEDKLR